MEFKLPDIGEGVHEGEIVRWLVKEGDQLAVDQPMVEIMTDKATVEIPSPRAGRVGKRMFAAGQLCPVGKVLITIELEAGAPGETAETPVATKAAAVDDAATKDQPPRNADVERVATIPDTAAAPPPAAMGPLDRRHLLGKRLAIRARTDITRTDIKGPRAPIQPPAARPVRESRIPPPG